MIPLAVIGGGATGAIVAQHLRALVPDLPPITIIEPRETLGAGLAYSATRPEHRINVPATKMSAVSAEPLDFATWMANNADEPALPNGEWYPPRATFGAYLAARLAPHLKNDTIRHHRSLVTRVEGKGPFAITTDDGTVLTARLAVIATSHPTPRPPRGVPFDSRVIADPWNDAALTAIAPTDRVVIIGTGLTMADMVATLAANGHHGPVLAFSRRGLRARGHALTQTEPFGVYDATTARALVRQIRQNIALSGHWHRVIDAVRHQGNAIWARLPLAEKKRVIRHLRPFWDVHRFRIAPHIETTLNEKIMDGTLEIVAARLTDVRSDLTLILHTRHGIRHWKADRIINATGPNHAGVVSGPGFLGDLARKGIIAPDPVGLGLHTAPDYRAVGQDRLFIAGPLTRGTFGELMGLPEITVHAEACAASIAHALAREGVLS